MLQVCGLGTTPALRAAPPNLGGEFAFLKLFTPSEEKTMLHPKFSLPFRQHDPKPRASKLAFHQHDISSIEQCAFSGNRQSQSHAPFLKRNRGLEERPRCFLT